MKRILMSLLLALFVSFSDADAQATQTQDSLYLINEFSVGQNVGLLRAAPVALGKDKTGFLMVYSADKDIDPWVEMFYPPTDRLKFEVVDADGKSIWKKEVEPGLPNSIWMVPVFPFDTDQDGIDEIYYVTNIDSVHVVSLENRRLQALDAQSGEALGQWEWPRGVERGASLSHAFRFFIMGGYVNDQPVLLTAQGTYTQMAIQAWDAGMNQRWEHVIQADDPGARGSHQTPVVDIDQDGIDELMWGERCISIDQGQTLFVADEKEYVGHSDVIQPALNRTDGKWYIYTCRENDDKGNTKPRVVMFDDQGQRVWTDLENGHMDMGWIAHTGSQGEAVAFTISRGGKKAGPEGFFRLDVVEYSYDAWTGERIQLPFTAYNTIPVDLNGDGIHEFARAYQEQSDWKVYDAQGILIGSVGEKGYVAMASKFLDLPGEQLFCYYPDGSIKIWGLTNAKDNEVARSRYEHPFYRVNQKQTAQGYNMVNLGGL